jgi:uroporphyrinogen decarboxylase
MSSNLTKEKFSSMERILQTLSHKESDRVPYILSFTHHGAKLKNISIKNYFSNPQTVHDAQLKLWQKYGADAVIGVHSFAMEVEPWGGTMIYYTDGPPNSGKPPLSIESIDTLDVPSIDDFPKFQNVLKTMKLLKESMTDKVPIVGGLISPFSLPIIQLGLNKYIDLLYSDPKKLENLLAINQEFCLEWANAQLEAGATFICYFDPMASTDMIPRKKYLETGYKVAEKILPQIKGPTVYHFTSARVLPILDEIQKLPCAVISASCLEDLSEMKEESSSKQSIIGNFDAIKFRVMKEEEIEEMVKDCILKGGNNGGYIFSDNHGELPWQISFKQIELLSKFIRKLGKYPLKFN